MRVEERGEGWGSGCRGSPCIVVHVMSCKRTGSYCTFVPLCVLDCLVACVLRLCVQRTDDLRGRDALEARDKVLGLIQQWGEEFLTRHNCTGTELFVQTYRELRVKGESCHQMPFVVNDNHVWGQSVPAS